MKTLTLTYDGVTLFTKEVDLPETRLDKLVYKVGRVARTYPEIMAEAEAIHAAALASRTPEQVAEDERIAALTSEEREIEFAQKEKEMLEAQLAEVSDKVAVSMAAMSLKSAPVEKLAP